MAAPESHSICKALIRPRGFCNSFGVICAALRAASGAIPPRRKAPAITLAYAIGVALVGAAEGANEVTQKCRKKWQDLQPLWRDIAAGLA
jgi:hypothetical protein